MSERHEEIVEALYEEFTKNIDESRWDDVYKNVNYYHDPSEIDEDRFGNQRGEMDVFCIDASEKTVMYIEVKTNKNDLSYAKEQLNRSRNYWEKKGWEFIGRINVNGEMIDESEVSAC